MDATGAAEPPQRRRVEPEHVIVGLAAMGFVLVYAFRNGLYDVVARGEAGILIWVVLGLGWATGVFPRRRASVWLWPCVAGFGALALWTTISLSWTASDERTVVELGRLAHHAGLVLLAASILTRRAVPALLGGLAAGAALVSWVGLCNRLWPNSVSDDVVRSVFGADRLSYPLDYWNGMAAFGAMAVVACLAMATHARNALVRAAFSVPIPGIVAMIYLTYSRGGAFELAIGLVVLLAFARHRFPLLLQAVPLAAASAAAILTIRDHDGLIHGTGSAGAGTVVQIVLLGGVLAAVVAFALERLGADERLRAPARVGRRAAIGAGFLVVVALLVAGPSPVNEVQDSFDRPVASSVTDDPAARFSNLGGARKAQFEDAWDSFKDHPLKGTGPGTYEFTWNQSKDYGLFVRDVHNIYLEALAESGLPGLLALLLILGGAAVVAVLAVVRAETPAQRGVAAGGTAVLAVFLFAAGVDWMWELTAVSALPLVLVGGLAATLAPRTAPRAPAWRRRTPRVAVPLVTVLALFAIVPPVVSTSQVRKSQAAARAGDVVAALRHADDSIDAAPWSATAMTQKALVLEDAGHFGEAEGYAALAIEREPTNWRHALLRARVAAERGDADAAVRWYRRAKQLAPRNPALP